MAFGGNHAEIEAVGSSFRRACRKEDERRGNDDSNREHVESS